MLYEARLLGNYGKDSWEILEKLKKIKCIRKFEIAYELYPYLHYHIWFEVEGKSLIQVKRIIQRLPKLYNIRGSNNTHCDTLKYGLEAFQKYMRKQGNPVINRDYGIDMNISECQFND